MKFLSQVFVKKTQKDPVCGMGATEGISYKHKGEMYYFCSTNCQKEFEADPERFINKDKK